MFVSAIPVAYRPSFGDCQSDVVPAVTKSCHMPRYDVSASCLALSTGDKVGVVAGPVDAGTGGVEVLASGLAGFPELHAASASTAAPTANIPVTRLPPRVPKADPL